MLATLKFNNFVDILHMPTFGTGIFLFESGCGLDIHVLMHARRTTESGIFGIWIIIGELKYVYKTMSI